MVRPHDPNPARRQSCGTSSAARCAPTWSSLLRNPPAERMKRDEHPQRRRKDDGAADRSTNARRETRLVADVDRRGGGSGDRHLVARYLEGVR